MQVREAMSAVILTVGPGHTLRQAAALMAKRKVGAAVVMDPEGLGHGILTERDILHSIGAGQDVDAELVGEHGLVDHLPDGGRLRDGCAGAVGRHIAEGVEPHHEVGHGTASAS